MTTQTTQAQMAATAAMARTTTDVARPNATPSTPAVGRAATAEDRWSRFEPAKTEPRLRLVPTQPEARAETYAPADQDAAQTTFFEHPFVIRIATLAMATVIVGAAFLPVLMQAAQVMQ